MSYFVLAFALAGVVAFIIAELGDVPLNALFCKIIASFGFILVFVAVIAEKSITDISPYYVGSVYFGNAPILLLFLLGLVAGLIGDIVLGLRPLRPKAENEKLILSGMISFSTGHVFYYVALLLMYQFSVYAILIAAVMTVVIHFGGKILKLEFGRLHVASLAYTLIVFLVFGQALVNAIASGFTVVSTLMVLGAFLFALSDLILAQIYFGGKTAKLFIATNLGTYYAAQLLLAFSLFFLA